MLQLYYINFMEMLWAQDMNLVNTKVTIERRLLFIKPANRRELFLQNSSSVKF